MIKRLLPAIVVLLFVAGLGTAGAQPVAPSLSELGRPLLRYMLTEAELPAGVRLSGPLSELSNEALVAFSPDLADEVIFRFGRLTAVDQNATRAGAPGQISIGINLFLTADGAWGDTLNSTFAADARVERTLPGPAIGERSVVFHTMRGSGAGATEAYYLGFQRERLEVFIGVVGPQGSVKLDEILPIGEAIDAKIVAAPPSPPTATEQAELVVTPSELVRGAVRLVLDRFIDALDVDALLYEAWDGATRALFNAGAQSVPPPPAFTRDQAMALRQFEEAFQVLETLAQNARLAPNDLAYAAIREIANRRNDCHTYFYTPEQWKVVNAIQSGQQGPPAFGISWGGDPVRIMSVVPYGPSFAAGLRPGQQVLAVNGRSAAGVPFATVRTFLNTTEGALNTFTVRTPSGRTLEIRVAPARFRVPPLEATVLEGNLGLIRIYNFQPGNEQFTELRRILADFEAKGVTGWIIDLRDNGGGASNTRRMLTGLFLPANSRLDGLIARGGAPQYSNNPVEPLASQRPLVFLVNELSLIHI